MPLLKSISQQRVGGLLGIFQLQALSRQKDRIIVTYPRLGPQESLFYTAHSADRLSLNLMSPRLNADLTVPRGAFN